MKELFIVYFAGLFVFHVLERMFPLRPAMRSGPTRRGYFADLTASLVDGPVLSGLTKIASYWVISQVPRVTLTVADWTWVAQFGLFFVANDFGRYWLHRWHHALPFLWRLHRVHHTVVEMDCLSTFRVHVLEGVSKYGLLVLPFHLIGIPPGVIKVYSSIDILKGFWHHANLKTCIGPLNYVLNSGEQHAWHHSTEARGQLANYGSVLSIWDRLFGTFYWPRGEWPTTIGVEGMAAFPDTYHAQFASILYTDEDLQAKCAEHDDAAGEGARAPVTKIGPAFPLTAPALPEPPQAAAAPLNASL